MSVQPQTSVMDPQVYTEEGPHLSSPITWGRQTQFPVCADLIHNEQPHYNWMEWLTLDSQLQRRALCHRGHSALFRTSSSSSFPKMVSGPPPSPWNSSSISCSPAVPALDAHNAAPSLSPSERSSRAYSKNAASMSLCASAGQGELREKKTEPGEKISNTLRQSLTCSARL